MRLVDTNVLIYAVSNREADSTKQAVAQAIRREPDLALSGQVLQEFYYQATRLQGPAGLTHEQALAFLRPLATLPIQEITVALFHRATEIKARFGSTYWDPEILAESHILGCEAVYSEDLSQQQDYGGLRVIYPF